MYKYIYKSGGEMAKDIFYSLKEKKRKNLINAIEECLKDKSYEKLSIEDILKTAEISRGSFYKYFNDKDDAIYTYVDERIRYLFEIYKICIIECNYRLFDGTVEAYNCLKYMMKESVYKAFYNNLKSLIGILLNNLNIKKYSVEIEDFINWCIENSIEGKSVLKTKEQMEEVVELLATIFIETTIKMVIIPGGELDNIDFGKKISIIKKGIMG